MKDNWDKVKILATVVTPFVVALVGWLVSSSIQQREAAIEEQKLNAVRAELLASYIDALAGTDSVRQDIALSALKAFAPEAAEAVSEAIEPRPILDQKLEYFHTPEVLEAAGQSEAAQHISVYAELFSRRIDEHRALLGRLEYNVGPTGLGLSTLDRFPLVSGQSGGCWYVPNLRTLVGAATPAPHFTLMKRCPDDYADARGFGLEQYLASMVKERMPSLSVIPEKTWPSTMGEVAGPDLILLDHGRKPVTIGIEIKARRMVPSTRFDLGQEELANNYDELWGATARVFNKLDEILGGSSGGYQEFATDLGRAREYPRMAIGIAGEAPYLFGELSTRQAQVDSQNPLHGLSDWTVMSSESFERMIEVTVQDNRELGDVLDDYVEDCHNLELSCPMAEFYRNQSIDEAVSYAATFLEGIWPG